MNEKSVFKSCNITAWHIIPWIIPKDEKTKEKGGLKNIRAD